MATVGSHARFQNLRGFAVPPGTMSLVGATPFGSGVLNSNLTSGATIATNPITLAASPTWGAEFGTWLGGGGTFGNVPTLALLNNGTTKQCIGISNTAAPSTPGPQTGTVGLTCSGINVTTYQDAFNTTGPKTTSVSIIPAEYITTGGTTYLSAADAPPAVGGNCLRYNVVCASLPNVQVDIAESTHPTTPLAIVLKMGAEVQPFTAPAPYDFENSGINIVQNIVSAAGGMSSIILEAIFAGGSAWNSNTGLTIGHPKAAIHLAARYMTIINWAYTTYCLTTGSKYPSGASGNLPLYLWGGSGACAGIMLCCQYYGLGWRKDIYPTMIMLDSPGATILTYREMSGVAGDNNYNPVVAAGTSAGGMQTVAEGLLDDQGASYPPSQGGNWNPTTLQPLGGLGDGQGPSYQNLFNSGWAPGGAYAGTIGALTVHTGAGFTISSNTSPATFTADGTATGWPGASTASRDVNGIVTLPLTGGGSVLCSYNSIVTGSPNTFKGCTWSKTGAVASGAALVCGGTSTGYIAAGQNLSNQSDGPFALPGSALAPNNIATRYLRFLEGANDVSNLPVLINTWLPNSSLSSSRYLWQVVAGAPHDIASTPAGAATLEAHLFNQPVVLQNISQNFPGAGTAASPVLPGWKVNGINPSGLQNNNGTILFAVVWGSNTTIPAAPITTQSPASGIHAWTRVPAGQAAATYTVPIDTGTQGIVTVFTKVATGLETAADFAWPVPTSGSIYAIVVGEAGVGLDNPVQNTNISVVDGAGSHASGFSGYGIDVCGAAAGVGVTTLTANNNTPTGTGREIAICFVATTIAADMSAPLAPSNGYGATLLNGTASYATTGTNHFGGSGPGALGIAIKNVTSSSTTNFTITSSGSANIGAGYFVLKGSVGR